MAMEPRKQRTSSLPSPREHAYITQVKLIGLCDLLGRPEVVAQLAADAALCARLRTEVGEMRYAVEAQIAEVRRLLGLGK